jgi:two-component system, sensor histidine kinase and response regulator
MKKILVIEDDKSVRETILQLLATGDFKLLAAANGRIGVELAQEQNPDLILCDVIMPELDGYKVLKKLRENPATATIPFIYLTGRSEKNDFRQGMELGADDYLTKPFTQNELIAAITSRLEKQVTLNQQSQKKLEELRSSISLSLPLEMRTPINNILGYSQILLAESEILEPQAIRDMAAGIHNSGDRLYRLIQNFLIYAELEIICTDQEQIKMLRGQQTIFPTPDITSLISEKAKKAGRLADLELYLQASLVQISVKRLYKIIEELIDNALKFSSSGTKVKVLSSCSNNIFTLSFIDHGRGMTPAQIAELGAYRQFERKLYEQKGTGLGLIIAKRLAELHGGELKIYSKSQEKTIAQVLLPCVIN